MSSSRRTFLHQASALSLLYGTRQTLAQTAMGSMKMGEPQRTRAQSPSPNPPHVGPPMLHTLELAPFVDPLPIPETLRPTRHHGHQALTITMQEVHAKVHRDVAPTRMWSYGPGTLSPLIEARAGETLQIHWVNNLPAKHFLPIDHSLHGCGVEVPEVRTTAHLHGAKSPSSEDGYPDSWFVPGKSRTCTYPLQQEATALWFHDHAMGLNRLNTYAGLFGMLLLRDKVEDSLNLPSGRYEVPLILYDRDFTAAGQLFYDVSGDPESPWIPEFSADGILINGKIRPFFEVEPRLYRFRMLNTANSRFFNLSLSNGQPLVQIGCDQGLLAAPVTMKRLVLGCAERADVLIDFSQLAGQTIHLRTGALDILEFRVGKQPAVAAVIPKMFRPIERISESTAVKTRTLTLHEYQDEAARPMVMLINRKHWHEPTTELPKLNSTEIWEFVNLTEDTHPMHLHLVRFQVLDRRPFDTTDYLIRKKVRFTAPAAPPESNEYGWKDTVQCPPGMITRIIMRFEGYPGKYLYHCHILEHEANDMMRPFEVVA
ncbi:multicopper oxidase family protein [Granulicella arctica]|uniref:multicopper oxidase family protein n=1 Tax=Granulicella arctica TaxID=940613 RepID=UPI0021E049A2|nr:multicopper oxidase domain-containing protein [Granulicella arctica]